MQRLSKTDTGRKYIGKEYLKVLDIVYLLAIRVAHLLYPSLTESITYKIKS